ncbi:MAG TPA: carboxypeptidase-like regulatory domain-containing protein [Gemmatimonadaceae bacterium]|nr:carboxypeptidase-like regulatory domain-containing protein [Gemmatimonadaceae bacterium]
MPVVPAIYVVLCLTCLAAHAAQAQQPVERDAPLRRETLRGRVVADSGGPPLPGAKVTVTMGPLQRRQSALADAAGEWAIVFDSSSGDYLIVVEATGWVPWRRRIARETPAGPGHVWRDSVLVLSTILARPTVTRLAAVRVEAPRARPERRAPSAGPDGPGVGAAEHDVEGVSAVVSPDAAGDPFALAATTPGVVSTASGVSVLGLDPAQTRTTLDGLAFIGGALPRDVRTTTKVSTSTYDPARGWFGGAEIAMQLAPAMPFSSMRSHLTLDASARTPGAIRTSNGRQPDGLQASLGGDGSFLMDGYTYTYGAQLSRRSAPSLSLLSASDGVLRATGAHPDSVARLGAILRDLDVPSGRAGEQQVGEGISLIGRVDRPPFDMRSFEVRRRTFGVTGFASWRRSSALGAEPFAMPSEGGDETAWSAGAQGTYSAYLGRRDWLLDLRTTAAAASERRTPYLDAPRGVVLLARADDAPAHDGSATLPAPGVAPVSFGGNSGLRGSAERYLWESQAELRVNVARHPKHRLTITGDARYDAVDHAPGADRAGTFVFASLDEVARGAPVMYSRDLGAASRRAGVWNGFLSTADSWRLNERLEIMLGVRAEARRFDRRLPLNGVVDERLGVRTDRVPDGVGVSPRLGFTWRYAPRAEGFQVGELGSIRASTSGVLRGGIGEFRDILLADGVAAAIGRSGLEGAESRLLCIGDAVPEVRWRDWTASGSAPTTCRAGAPSQFVEHAPSVLAFAPDYEAPRSWRANVGWSGLWKRLVYSIDGIVSLNRSQPSLTDENFAGVRHFLLPGEDRPIFVPLADIDAPSGVVSPVGARKTGSFGRVELRRSDLRSTSRRLTVALAPAHADLQRWFGTVAYSLGSARQEVREREVGMFEDPRARTWARGVYDVRHQWIVQAGYARRGLTASVFGRASSGRPFTPLIGRDVNGDGLANDRAFVHDPARARAAGDTALAAETERLLGTAPRRVRDCLAGSLSRAATVNACEGPWTATLNARIGAGDELTRLGRRVNVALHLTNVLGGVDRLLHGERLRGWGEAASPDPVLYDVRRFDAATRQFAYVLNPRFGRHRHAAFQRTPFRISLDVTIDLGRPMSEQQLDRWLRPGRAGHPGARLGVAELRRRYARTVPDPFAAVLGATDSLLLSPSQTAALEGDRQRYRQQVDSVWTRLATSFAALEDHYDVRAAHRLQEDATDAAWEIARVHAQRSLPGILTSAQRRLVPSQVERLLRAPPGMKARVYMGW